MIANFSTRFFQRLTLASVIVCRLFFETNAQLVLTYAGTLQVSGSVDAAAPLAQFNNPHGIAVDPDGVVYVADRYNHTIRKIDLLGNVTTIAGKAGIKGAANGFGAGATFNEPWGICFGTDGFIYVADTRNNKIRRVTPDGEVTTYAGTGSFGVFDGPAATTTWGNPTGVEMDAAGNLYVAEHLTHTIRKIAPNGIVSTIAGSPYLPGAVDGVGGAARFWRPYGISLDKNGQILVADEWNHRIRRVNPQTGAVTTIAGNGQVGAQNGSAAVATFNYPWDVVSDSVGNLFVADGYNYVIRKISPGGFISTWCGTLLASGGVDGTGTAASFSGATSIRYCKKQDVFYVGDAYNQLVRRIVPNLGGTASIGIANPPALGKTFCVGDTAKIIAGPPDYAEYRFYQNGEIVQQSANNILSVKLTTAGVYVFKSEVVNGSEILTSDDLKFTVSPLPDAFLTVVGETTFFDGDSVTLIASAGDKYLWSNGSTKPILNVKTEGLYFVMITNSNGCRAVSDSVFVEVNPVSETPKISLDGDSRLCAGESVTLTSSYSTGNQWLKDNFPMAGKTAQTLVVSQSGEYRVRVKDDLGFTLTSSPVEIEVSDFQIVSVSASTATATVGELVEFSTHTSEPAQNFFWTFGDGTSSVEESPKHSFAAKGFFTVTLVAESAEGCLDTLQKNKLVEVKAKDDPDPDPDPQDSLGIWIPNAFSPNGDGENDLFKPYGSSIDRFSLKIFNHWGEQIFVGQNLQTGWDGRCTNGQPGQMATYTYLADIRTKDERQLLRTGKITLLR